MSEQIAVAAAPALTAWDRVKLARHAERPHALDYVRELATDWVELHGDRSFGDDQALVGGLARIGAHRVMVLGHQKGNDTRENLARNFGMARPEGYRKAERLMRHAEKFGFPLVTFIDTPGAEPGIGSEERGQATAIAESLLAMADLATPSVAVVIGEGGSGGALAIGVADRILMLENAIYAVASPEACAAILWKDAGRAPLPIYWGNRNWDPLLRETVTQMAADGITRAACFVTSAYSSYSGCRQYRENLFAAIDGVEGAPRLDRLRAYFNHPGFLEPFIDAAAAGLGEVAAGERRVAMLFVTHSIPESMNAASGAAGGAYLAQHHSLMESILTAVRERTGLDPEAELVFCSRSGPPQIPWLEPDVNDRIEQLGVHAVGKGSLLDDIRGLFAPGETNAARIDHGERMAQPFGLCHDTVAGDSSLVMDDRYPLAHNAIKQGGFTHIRTANNGDET